MQRELVLLIRSVYGYSLEFTSPQTHTSLS